MLWLEPQAAQVESLLPKRHRRQRKSPTDQLAERFGSLSKDVLAVLESQPRFVRPSSGLLAGYPQYETLHSVVFVSTSTLLLVLFSQAWSCLRDTAPGTPSLVATVLVVVTALAALAYLVVRAGWTNQEAKLAVAVGVAAGLVALGTLRGIPTSVLDVPLAAGIADMMNVTNTWLKPLPNPVTVELSPIVVESALAAFAGLFAFAHLLPAFRWAQTHFELTQKAVNVSPGLLVALHANFWLPLLVSVCWFRPLTAQLLLPTDLVKCHADDLDRDCTAVPHDDDLFILTESRWNAIRVGLVLVTCVVRFGVMRINLQSYLGSAKTRVANEVMQFVGQSHVVEVDAKKAGADDLNTRLTEAVLNKCREVTLHVNVAATQYIAPNVLLGALALLLFRAGDISCGICTAAMDAASTLGFDARTALAAPASAPSAIVGLTPRLTKAVFGVALESSPSSVIFTRAVLYFAVWWAATCWFILSAFAMMYWRLIDRARAAQEEEARLAKLPPTVDAASLKKGGAAGAGAAGASGNAAASSGGAGAGGGKCKGKKSKRA